MQSLPATAPCNMEYIHGREYSSLENSLRKDLTKLQYHIIKRLIPDEKDWNNFISSDLHLIPSPFLLPDIEESVKLILSVVRSGKHILLYGDRDTDGVSSTSLLAIYLKPICKKYNSTITIKTSSANDDYGLCKTVLDTVKKISPELLITLDFGTSNFEEINELDKLGIKVIVLDHHEIPTRIPNCQLINPKREDSIYPEKKICTSVLAITLILAIHSAQIYENELLTNSNELFIGIKTPIDYSKINFEEYLNKYPELMNLYKDLLDLSSVGTVTDMMPLIGFNRVVVKNGLDTLTRVAKENIPEKLGLKFLLKELDLNPSKVISKDLGWAIGPVLNAAGRMGKTEVALSLLTTENVLDASKYGKEIIQLNSERKERTKRNIYRVEEYFKRKPERESKKIIFCYEPDMEPGVSGIVATRLVEKYKRPVVFVTPDHGKARGSVRTFGKENVLDLLNSLSDLFEHFGGHPEAGGFSVPIEKISELETRLEIVAEEWLMASSLIEIPPISSLVSFKPDQLKEEIFKELLLFEPFGQGNPVPLLSIKNAELTQFKPMGDGNHAKFSISSNSKIKGVIWGRAKELFTEISKKQTIDLFGSLEENYFKGNTSIQFVVSNFY